MRSRLEISRCFDGGIHFNGFVSDADMVLMRLSAADQALFDDCMGADCTAADWLLGIEMLFRRMEEQLK